MQKIIKFTIITSIIFLITLIGTYFFINSNSFAGVIKGKISSQLGNEVNFEKHKIGIDGTITITNFSLLALDKTELLQIRAIKVKIDWLELINNDTLPQTITLNEANLSARIKNNQWPLHILNEQHKPTPLPNFDLNIDTCNIVLEKISGNKYNVKLTIKEISSELIQPIQNVAIKGEISPELVKVTDLTLNTLGGRARSVFTAWFAPELKLELELKTESIRIEQALKYMDTKGVVIEGELDSTNHLTFRTSKDFKLNGKITTSQLLAKGDSVDEILELIKKRNHNLLFEKSSASFSITPQALLLDRLRVENSEFITILADSSHISLNKALEPENFTIPLKIRAPYEVIKWKDYKVKEDPKHIEIPLNLSGKVSDIESILFKSLLATIQQNSITRGIRKIEEKLNIKIDSTKVKAIVQAIDLEPIKEEIKKQVNKIDTNQLNNIIDTFEKDSKKREMVKKQINSFLKFLQ